MGAEEQPSVALWEPSRNERVTKFPALQIAGASLSVNLLKIKERKNRSSRRKKSSRRSSHDPFAYFVFFLRIAHKQTT
jgi:hypothetical protein